MSASASNTQSRCLHLRRRPGEVTAGVLVCEDCGAVMRPRPDKAALRRIIARTIDQTADEARLTDAAPDMLAVLRELSEQAPCPDCGYDVGDEADHATDCALDAVVALATGRSPS